MKKCRFLWLFIFIFILLIPRAKALTVRETIYENDGYSTLDEGSVIIGVTRFSPNKIVTASRAALAGADDVKLHLLQNGNVNDYEAPGVYYYIDSYVGWFFLDSDNNATPVVDEEELEELSKIDIYYVDNVEKVLQVDYLDGNIDESTLPTEIKFNDNKLFINATISEFEFKTEDQKEVSFVFDSTISQFVRDIKTCYTVDNGMITSYNFECGSEVVIPLEYNNEKITGISDNAFRDTNIVRVVIPNEINSLGSNSFADNDDLLEVLILGKSSSKDFEYFGNNVFGDFKDIVYENKVEVSGIILNKTDLVLDVGDSDILVASISPEDATDKEVSWTSSNVDVVTVNNGEVIAVGSGSATIIASVGEKSVVCTITVNKKITYTYEWEKIGTSVVDEYYLYIVDSDGNKVSGRVNIKYNNDKNKEFNISKEGIKVVKSAVFSVEIISIDI